MSPTLTPTQERFLEMLRRDGEVFQSDAVERLGVTPRTLRRAAKALVDAGHGVRKETRGGQRLHVLDPEERHPLGTRLDLTERQALALVVATEAARPILGATPFRDDLRDALGVLLGELDGLLTFEPETVSQQFHFQNAPSADLDPQVFTTVRRSVVTNQTIAIDYYTASRGEWSYNRRVDPLGLSCVNGAWLCAAWCHEAQDIRDFNLVGIDACTPTGDTYTPPKGFDVRNHFGGRFGALAGEDVHTVRLRLMPDTVAYFRRKRYHPTQTLGPVQDDGTAEVTFEVHELESVAAFVRSWGPKLEVVAPDVLRASIREDAKKMAQRYR